MIGCKDIVSEFGCVERDADLSCVSLYRCGGRAEFLARPETPEELGALLKCAKQHKMPVNVIGNGSNILVSDNGVAGLVVRLDTKAFCSFSLDGNVLESGAGVKIGSFVSLCRDKGFHGFEYLWGVPATVGGAVVMNAGAQGCEICDVLVRVEIIGDDGAAKVIAKEDIDFGYRYSSLSKLGVVTRAWFKLEHADKKEIEETIAACKKQKTWIKESAMSCGCVFKNPEGTSAGRLLDSLGAKGMTNGGAMVSREHANVIVNTGGASSQDIFALMFRLEEMALEAGVKLEPEIKLMGDFSL